MGFLPRQEVVREVALCARAGAQPLRRAGAESPYGRLMADALREAAPATGGDGRQGRVSTTRARRRGAGDPAV